MPYGYAKDRQSKNYSPYTVNGEVHLILELLGFINQKYKKAVEPFEIRPADIKEFLDMNRSKGLLDSTVSRKLTQISTWFSYMWETGQIKHDFMPKLQQTYKTQLSKSKNNTPIVFTYDDLLNRKSAVLSDVKLTKTAKLLFIFFMRGLRIRDILQIRHDDFTDNISVLNLRIETVSETVIQIEFDDPMEINILLTEIEKAVFKDVPYIFSKKKNGEYTSITEATLKYSIAALSNFFNTPLTSTNIRYAYIHYLYTKKKMKIEEIQLLLGQSLEGTTRSLNKALERMQTVEYNLNESEKLTI